VRGAPPGGGVQDDMSVEQADKEAISRRRSAL
jgi:hypothetical protein